MENSPKIDLPNPFTPMAFFPPEIAFQLTVLSYVVVGGLSVLLWDILSHLYADWKLLTEYKVSLPTITYFLSRSSTLAYVLVVTIFQTAPSNKCFVLGKTTCTLFHITVSSTALLFFFRVCAIFNKNRYIVVIFFILWCSVLGGSLTAIFVFDGANIGNTKYCTFVDYKSFFSTANATIAVFDTSVFLGITWYLLINQSHANKDGDKIDFFGRHLPSFTRALVQDGQKYYIIVAVLNLLALILDFAPGIPIPYRQILVVPNVSLNNILACRVFRNTKMYYENESVGRVSELVFRRTQNYSTKPHNRESSTAPAVLDDALIV